jgi:hypothetical protein
MSHYSAAELEYRRFKPYPVMGPQFCAGKPDWNDDFADLENIRALIMAARWPI